MTLSPYTKWHLLPLLCVDESVPMNQVANQLNQHKIVVHMSKGRQNSGGCLGGGCLHLSLKASYTSSLRPHTQVSERSRQASTNENSMRWWCLQYIASTQYMASTLSEDFCTFPSVNSLYLCTHMCIYRYINLARDHNRHH